MVKLGYLGPVGTYSEEAAQSYAQWQQQQGVCLCLVPMITIAGCLEALAVGELDLALVPSENSVEGSVNITLDSLWRLDTLHIQYAFIRPIVHAFIAQTTDFAQIQAVYSHPQALGQCQRWLQAHLPHARQCPGDLHRRRAAIRGSIRSGGGDRLRTSRPTPSTTHCRHRNSGYSRQLHAVLGGESPTGGWLAPAGDTHTSIAFSLKANAPGALLKVLQLFSDRQINLSRIESRPSKRALGDYLFFVDLEVNGRPDVVADCLLALKDATDVLKVFGSYQFLDLGE